MNPIEQGIEFIIKNSLVSDNMIVLSPDEITLIQASQTLLYSIATEEEYKDYSLPDCAFLAKVTLGNYDARVLVFRRYV